jgi:hypothetical protein
MRSATFLSIAGLLFLAIPAAAGDGGTGGGVSNQVGAFATYGEDDELLYGLIFFKDITRRDRFSISLKAFDLDGEQSKRSFNQGSGY